MATFFALSEIAIALMIVYAACNSLRNRGDPAFGWLALGVSMIVGVVLGVWFAFFFDYQSAPGCRVYSFPVPGGFHILEANGDGVQQWVDFVTPAPLLVAVANTVAFVGAMVLAMRIVTALWVWVGARTKKC